MNSNVAVSYLNEEELIESRIGAKCDLSRKPKKRDWKWRSEKGGQATKLIKEEKK